MFRMFFFLFSKVKMGHIGDSTLFKGEIMCFCTFFTAKLKLGGKKLCRLLMN